MEKFGVENIVKMASPIGKVVGIVDGMIHKGGMLLLFGLAEPMAQIGAANMDAIKNEFLDLSPEEQAQINVAFKAAVNFKNPAVEMNFDKALDIVEKVSVVARKQVALIGEEVILFNEIKAIFQP